MTTLFNSFYLSPLEKKVVTVSVINKRVLIPDTCTKEIKRSPFKFEEEFFISKGRVTFDF